MYSYNNMPQMNKNMYPKVKTTNYANGYQYQNGDDRFAGGLLAPLFLGGVAGYAIGYNRPNNVGYAYPMPYPQYPVYTNNYYYPYY
ncbi:MAG: hypothetical protein PUD59_03055 [bacterium]|nr:hypothetical protein [bacterium]